MDNLFNTEWTGCNPRTHRHRMRGRKRVRCATWDTHSACMFDFVDSHGGCIASPDPSVLTRYVATHKTTRTVYSIRPLPSSAWYVDFAIHFDRSTIPRGMPAMLRGVVQGALNCCYGRTTAAKFTVWVAREAHKTTNGWLYVAYARQLHGDTLLRMNVHQIKCFHSYVRQLLYDQTRAIHGLDSTDYTKCMRMVPPEQSLVSAVFVPVSGNVMILVACPDCGCGTSTDCRTCHGVGVIEFAAVLVPHTVGHSDTTWEHHTVRHTGGPCSTGFQGRLPEVQSSLREACDSLLVLPGTCCHTAPPKKKKRPRGRPLCSEIHLPQWVTGHVEALVFKQVVTMKRNQIDRARIVKWHKRKRDRRGCDITGVLAGECARVCIGRRVTHADTATVVLCVRGSSVCLRVQCACGIEMRGPRLNRDIENAVLARVTDHPPTGSSCMAFVNGLRRRCGMRLVVASGNHGDTPSGVTNQRRAPVRSGKRTDHVDGNSAPLLVPVNFETTRLSGD